GLARVAIDVPRHHLWALGNHELTAQRDCSGNESGKSRHLGPLSPSFPVVRRLSTPQTVAGTKHRVVQRRAKAVRLKMSGWNPEGQAETRVLQLRKALDVEHTADAKHQRGTADVAFEEQGAKGAFLRDQCGGR